MKKFFAKPKGPEKLTPFPLDSPSAPPPPPPPPTSHQPRRPEGLAAVFGSKEGQGVTPFPLEHSPTDYEHRQPEDNARVHRRSSLKADGKQLFGWGRDKDKERERDRPKEQGKLRKQHEEIREVREPPREEEQWTVITPTATTPNLQAQYSANIQSGYMPRNGPPPVVGYLPPGASPAKEQVSLIPDMQPSYPPQLPVQRSRGSPPIGPGSIPVQRHTNSASMDLQPPPVPHRNRAGSDSWSRNSSEQEQFYQPPRQARTNRRSDEAAVALAYGTSPRGAGIPEPMASPGRDNGFATSYGSPLAQSYISPTPVSFPQPRPAPPPPSVPPGSPDASAQFIQPMDGATRRSREHLSAPAGYRDGYRPSSPSEQALPASVSQKASQEWGDKGYAGQPYGASTGQSLDLPREKDKKKEKGKFFGLGAIIERTKDREVERHENRDSQQSSRAMTPSSFDNGNLHPRYSTDALRSDREYVNVDYPRAPSPMNGGGGVVQPVTVVSMTRKEEKEMEKREKEMAKDSAKREKDAERKASQEETVQYAIFKLCQSAAASDIAEILTIMERIDQSQETVAKDAARAVRKEMKNSATEAGKVFAAKIWLLGCTNSGTKGGFRTHAFEKKFMGTVQDILTAPHDKPWVNADTYERIRDTLAHLVHEFGRDKHNDALRSCWMKVKTRDEPSDGYPLPATHPVYSPKDRLLNNYTHLSGQPPLPLTPRPINAYNGFIPDETEDLKRLIRECTTARETATVLTQAVAFTTPAQLGEKPIIKEFYNNCVRNQESLISQMGWAHSQAERSRIQRGVDTPDPSRESFGDKQSSHGTGEEAVPLAEQVFAELLSANGELSEAIRLHDELESMARNEQEMRYVQERSKVDRRMDRSRYNQMDNDGLIPPPGIHDSGSSRSPSPSGRRSTDESHNERTSSGAHVPFITDPAGSVEGASLESYGYSGGYPVSRGSTPDSDGNQPPRFPKIRTASPTRNGPKGPRPLDSLKKGQNNSASSLRNVQSARTAPHPVTSGPRPFINDSLYVPRSRSDSEVSEEELSREPAVPSAKALGKRAAYPTDSGFDPDDIFGAPNGVQPSSNSSSSSDDDDDRVVHRRPIIYAYDAVVEREQQLHRDNVAAAARARSLRVGGGGSAANAEVEDVARGLGEVNIGARTPPVLLSGLEMSGNLLRQEQGAPAVGVKRKPSGRWKPWQRKDSS